MELLAALEVILGAKNVSVGDEIEPRYRMDWTAGEAGMPAIVARPGSTEDVAAVVGLCRQARQPIVPQGGRTGMVRGALALSGELVLSLERMASIEDIDAIDGTMTVGAGAILETVQDAAREAGYSLPLDLGGRGSCTIGGVIATNAGGNRVLRYGPARDMILGLEAVLGDGSVLSSMNRMVKNTAGYDLKHLLIGSEGTIGIVTKAVLRLRPAVRSESVALCAVPSFVAATQLLKFLNSRLGGQVSAFEAMWQDFYTYITTMPGGPPPPVATVAPFYALIEMHGGDADKDPERFEASLAEALELGLITDAVIASSARERMQLWAVRDAIGPALSAMPAFAPFDISIPSSRMEQLVDRMRALFAAQWPGRATLFFGHIGDMNLHALLRLEHHDDVFAVERAVYALLEGEMASVSGEHGIGTLKKEFLPVSRSPREIELMRSLKRLMDPDDILSPGRVFDQRHDIAESHNLAAA
jgi:FAD/FMN-containing dehydrogenase